MVWLHAKKLMKKERSMQWYQWRKTANSTGTGYDTDGPLSLAQKAKERDRRFLVPELGLREYWYPALADKDVKKKPVGVRICGDDLVFFRGKDGEVKALWNFCAHRGGSLADGLCEFEGTVTCPYHGWTYDGDGNVLAVLVEGPDSMIPGKVKTRVFPTVTLKGFVFVWMGDAEPAPIEEDVPPEFFDPDALVLNFTEYWPLNWRLAIENALDGHASYLHRNSMMAFIGSVSTRIDGPVAARSEIVNGRASKRPMATPDRPVANRGGLQPDVVHYPALNGRWPKSQWRKLWMWVFFKSNMKRPRIHPSLKDVGPEWSGFGQHLPSMVRLRFPAHYFTRASVPVDANLSREVYFHTTYPRSWFGRLYERLHYKVFHRWAMFVNFSLQDLSASAPQRYGTKEYLSSLDAQTIATRKLMSMARGLNKSLAEELPPQEAEVFHEERQAEAGIEPEMEEAGRPENVAGG
jgi:phenylpropionate dioxygenase-like ring-hydroxylating dioxygenase large terminal subunit